MVVTVCMCTCVNIQAPGPYATRFKQFLIGLCSDLMMSEHMMILPDRKRDFEQQHKKRERESVDDVML